MNTLKIVGRTWNFYSIVPLFSLLLWSVSHLSHHLSASPFLSDLTLFAFCLCSDGETGLSPGPGVAWPKEGRTRATGQRTSAVELQAQSGVATSNQLRDGREGKGRKGGGVLQRSMKVPSQRGPPLSPGEEELALPRPSSCLVLFFSQIFSL